MATSKSYKALVSEINAKNKIGSCGIALSMGLSFSNMEHVYRTLSSLYSEHGDKSLVMEKFLENLFHAIENQRLGNPNPYAIPPNESKTINGLLFTHEYDKDGDPKSSIYVEDCKDHSASLVCCMDTGCWLSENQNILVGIPGEHKATIKKVSDWWEGSEF